MTDAKLSPLALIVAFATFVAALAVVAAFYALAAAFVWNEWGLDFAREFNAANLTTKQAYLIGILIVALKMRPTGSKTND